LAVENKRKKNKHHRIIEAAIKVFAKYGFYNSKVSEIARVAQVADGTIYLYFHNKDDILITLFEEIMQDVLNRVQAAIALETDPTRKLERFAEAHLNLVKENQEVSEIIQVEIRQSSKFMRGYNNIKFAKYLNIISEIIKEGQKQGLLRSEIKLDIAKRAFFGALDEMSRYWVLSSSKKYSTKSASKEISAIFLRGMLTDQGRQNS